MQCKREIVTLTFIISNIVFNTMSIMIKYSNGVDTTILQILYLTLFRSFGIYLSSGRACIVKSIHDFWKINTELSMSALMSMLKKISCNIYIYIYCLNVTKIKIKIKKKIKEPTKINTHERIFIYLNCSYIETII